MKDINKMSAAEFKRHAINNEAHRRASAAVAVRSVIGSGTVKVSKQDKRRLRDTHQNREMQPAWAWKKENSHAS